MFQSEDMRTFTDILRGNDEIKKGNLMDDGSVNFRTLIRNYNQDYKLTGMKTLLFGAKPDDNPSFIKLKKFWSELNPEKKLS